MFYFFSFFSKVVSTHSSLMVKGMLSLLTVCPHEVAHLRKELLIAARHILATELRIKFVPLMEKLFDENILLVSFSLNSCGNGLRNYIY